MSLQKPAVVVSNLGKCYESDAGVHTNFRERIYELIRLKKKEAAAESFWALRNIDFEIRPGEVVGIIGANGAGKSTLLKLLAEVTEPTEGSIQFRGKVISILDIGTGFHPDLTGIENIYLSGSLLGMNKKEVGEKISSIIDFSELGEFINRPVKHFSSGMFLRLAFSVCTHLDADILLLDEVISVGDAAFSIKSLKRIREIAAQGKTILLASHDLASVQHLCTQCILLEKGALVDVGDTSQLVERYIEQGVFKSFVDLKNTSRQFSFIAHRRDFSAENNDCIAVKELRIFSASKTIGAIEMSDEVMLECSFEKNVAGEVALSYLLTYNMQASVLSAVQFNNRNSFMQTFDEPGTNEATCKFPSHFFNHGIFSVAVFFTDAAGKVLWQLENALVFKVEQSEISSSGLKYGGKYHGALYPKLEWQFEQR